MRLNPVKPSQRPYVASHPVVFWLTIGIALVGLSYFLYPQGVEESAASLLFPEWLKIVFATMWTLGGGLGFAGIARGKPNLEGAGMSLLSAGLFGQFAATWSVRPGVISTALFVLALGIGCAHRAYGLASRGYSR